MGLILATLALTCNESPEPPKPPLGLADLLADLPLEILGMIIERLDFREQRILRKTAKKAKLRELVRKQRPACTRLSINYQPDGIICKYIHGYDEYRVAFFSPGMEIEEFQAQNFPSHEFIQADNYEEVALRDVGVTLRNPKLRLEKLETSHTVFNRHTLIEHIHHPVFVREIDFRAFNPSCLLLILPISRPRVLRKITIRVNRIQQGWEENPFFQQPPRQWNADEMGPVALLEQWTQAEELEMQYLFDILPMQHATHFKRLKFEDFYINQDKFDRIKNYLSEMDNFEQCIISYDTNLHLLLGRPVSRNETEDVFHQDIPGSNFYFEFICWPGDEFIVEKKRRNN